MEYIFKPVKPILRFLKYFLSYILLVVLFFFLSKKSLTSNAFLVLGVLISLQIPSIILFIQYYINDYNSSFSFEKSNNQICYEKGKKKVIYTIEQLKLIELTVTKPRLKKNNTLLKDDFFYYTFSFMDGSSVIITSVILNGKMINEANFNKMNFKKNIKFYPSIY
jgi:hypothetical protein